MIRAIQTAYDGRLFRSRAEARWAAFFKALGLTYEYEPEGFTLPDGRGYLVDFRVPIVHMGMRADLWVEVKPAGNDDGKLKALSSLLNVPDKAAILPSIEEYRSGQFDGDVYYGGDAYDSDHFFCICPDCGSLGFEHGGKYGRLNCCPTRRADHNEHEQSRGTHPPLIADAIDFALAQRFGT